MRSFHCLFCHGFEERGASSAGVLAGGFVSNAPMLAHIALMAKRLSLAVTVYTNANPSLHTEVQANLHSSKIRFDDRAISRFELLAGGPRVKLHFADGESATEGFLAGHPTVVQRAGFVDGLGVERLESGDVKTEAPFYETSVKGCFAAGDAATMMRSVPQAQSMGAFVAAGMVMQLQTELDAKDEL